MSGLTPTGFEVDTLDQIKEEMAQDARDLLGAELDTGPTSVVGQLIGIVAERVHAHWLSQRDVWQAFSPTASGQSLTQIALITGTVRRDATYSRVQATVNLNAGTTLPAGSRAHAVGDDTAVFETDADATNGGGTPADLAVTLTAVEAGPLRANAGTLTVIVTPVSGWNSITNAEDAELGLAAETDFQLRLRREIELRVQGSSNIDAIAADVTTVEGVIDVASEENTSDVTVGILPPHSFRIIVWDGDPSGASDDAIAQAIWDAKPAGIEAVGSSDGNALDANGDTRVIAFDRADEQEVWLEFDVEVVDSTFPVDGEDQIKEAVVAHALENWRIGEDVILSALYGPVFGVSGVYRIAAVRAGFSASPVGTSDLAVAADEIARADTARIEVTLV